MEISQHHEERIRRKVESGNYGTFDEVLDKALAALDDREQALADELAVIEAKLQVADEQFKNGQYTEYTDETLHELFDRVKRRGREILAAENTEPTGN